MVWKAFESPQEMRKYLPDPDPFPELKGLPGVGHRDPEIVVIKRNPTWPDIQANTPLSGKDGMTLRRVFIDSGIRFYATNAFPFSTKQGQNVTAKMAKAAAGVLAEELSRIPCRRYLLLGSDAAKWTPTFTYPFKKHNELLGHNITVDDATYRVTYAPMLVSNSPSHFNAFLEDLRELLYPDTVKDAEAPERERYHYLENPGQIRSLLAKAPKRIAVDTETTGLDPYTCELLTIQISWEEGVGYSFPFQALQPSEWAQFLVGRDLVMQNAQYDVKVLAANGIFVKVAEDTMVMHSLVDETPGTHNMELMAQRYLGIDKWSDTINYQDMKSNSPVVLGRYGARDADITLRLANRFSPHLEGRFIWTILKRAQNAIIASEIRGVRVDRDKAEQFRGELEAALHDKREYISQAYDLENPNSPQQVLDVLQKMGVPLRKVKGKYTTKDEAISPFIEDFPIIRDVLEYRHLTKAAGNYVKNVLAFTERDGRYHGEFKIAATETGRLAERLLMLIPRADGLENPDLGKQYQVRLRELFIPDEGMVMIGADYSGLEVAMAAYITGDRQLTQDVIDNLDTHSVVAIDAFGLDEPLEPYDTLKKRMGKKYPLQRTMAKSGTFTWLYGGQEEALMSGMGVSDREVATRVLTALRTRYKGVAEWQERIMAQAKSSGRVSTPWGRHRNFNFNRGLDAYVHEQQLREAINMPNQGMATDMNLAAFTYLYEAGVDVLFPFHDAVYAQAPEDQAERRVELIREVMENVLENSPVPFRVDVKTGCNWAEL